MDFDGPELKRLGRDECLRLLGSVPVGRVIYTRQALPAVELVNFALDSGNIVFRTGAGEKLGAAMLGQVVAFEADSLDFARHTGWSVTVVGQCQAVTDADEIERLRGTRLSPWAPGEREHYIRVPASIVNGRWLVSHALGMRNHADRVRGLDR
jgi:nitroimidazol reductase NimA-like FMN-containing flavoprotein (pyridoxamine 5'-phosphate oxidase superfamily)